jgi:formate dehydrogenase major subunit
MKVSRRQFLKGTGGVVVGSLALAAAGVDVEPTKAVAIDMDKVDRLKGAVKTSAICCYCSVGCGLVCYSDENGKILSIEGDPEHPINEGTLCPKGANIMQITAANEHRLKDVLYRAPYSDKWEKKDWDWTLTRIAEKIKAVRDADFMAVNSQGKTVNRVETIALHGSSNINNEECFIMASLARALGLVYIDHQARV